MQMKLPVSLLMVVLLLTALVPSVPAQEVEVIEPLAFVYNAQADKLVAIYSDEPGHLETYSLGLAELLPDPTSISLTANDLTFDDAGTRVAFCAVDYARNVESAFPARLIVRDLKSATNLVDLDLGTVAACRVPKKSFNFVSNTVLVSLTVPPAADSPTSPFSWRLIRVDAATGEITNEVNSTTPALANSDFREVPVVADIQYIEFSGMTVVFSLAPFGAGGIIEVEAYIWQIAVETVFQTFDWGQPIMDISPVAGERIYLDVDPNLPGSGLTTGDIPHYNAVRMVDSNPSARTIFHQPDGAFLDLAFINAGQQIAVQFVPDDPTANIRWIIVDRTGATTEINADHVYSDIQNAPGGYVNFWVDQIQGAMTVGSAFYLGYTTAENSVTLWNADSADSSEFWELAWVHPVVGLTGLPLFVNYAQ